MAALKIVRFADLIATPWKNGGGVTREILRREQDGAVVWRLSIADVASEGPFSVFPGLQRILTVIDGKGMRLVRSDGSFLSADLHVPVTFSGDELINGELPNGPCRDFNVIWDPGLAEASVSVIHPGEWVPGKIGLFSGILGLAAGTQLTSGESLDFGDIALVQEPVTLVAGRALAVFIREHSHP